MESLVISGGGRTLILEDGEAAMTVRLHTDSKRTAALLSAEQQEEMLGWLLERHARRYERMYPISAVRAAIRDRSHTDIGPDFREKMADGVEKILDANQT